MINNCSLWLINLFFAVFLKIKSLKWIWTEATWSTEAVCSTTWAAFRYLLKLQTEEIQIHAEEMSNLRKELEDERSERLELEEKLTTNLNVTAFVTKPLKASRSASASRGRHKSDADDVAATDIRRQVGNEFFCIFTVSKNDLVFFCTHMGLHNTEVALILLIQLLNGAT